VIKEKLARGGSVARAPDINPEGGCHCEIFGVETAVAPRAFLAAARSGLEFFSGW